VSTWYVSSRIKVALQINVPRHNVTKNFVCVEGDRCNYKRSTCGWYQSWQ